jgi:hypothetical protein
MSILESLKSMNDSNKFTTEEENLTVGVVESIEEVSSLDNVVDLPVKYEEPVKKIEEVGEDSEKEKSHDGFDFLSNILKEHNSYNKMESVDLSLLQKYVSNSDKADVFYIKETEDTPLFAKTIKDTSGRISNILKDISKEYNIHTIPETITSIPKDVKLKDYTSFIQGGIRHFVTKEKDMQMINSFVESVEEIVTQGEVYNTSLIEIIYYKGKEVQVWKWSPEEISVICTLLKSYGAKVIGTNNNSYTLNLVVGDFAYRG